MNRRESSLIKEWLLGVSTALTVACLGVVANLYTDVQVLKVQVANLEKYSESVIALDKKMELNNQTLEVVKQTLEELKADRTLFFKKTYEK